MPMAIKATPSSYWGYISFSDRNSAQQVGHHVVKKYSTTGLPWSRRETRLTVWPVSSSKVKSGAVLPGLGPTGGSGVKVGVGAALGGVALAMAASGVVAPALAGGVGVSAPTWGAAWGAPQASSSAPPSQRRVIAARFIGFNTLSSSLAVMYELRLARGGGCIHAILCRHKRIIPLR